MGTVNVSVSWMLTASVDGLVGWSYSFNLVILVVSAEIGDA